MVKKYNPTSTLNDNTLVKHFQNGDKSAGEVFVARHIKYIKKIAGKLLKKKEFDFTQHIKSEDESLSLATEATYDAMKTYDFTSCKITTWIYRKLGWYLNKKQEDYQTHCKRFKPLSSFEMTNDEGEETSCQDQIEYNVCKEMTSRTDYEESKIAGRKLLVNFLPVGSKERTCMELYIRAVDDGAKAPSEWVAKKMHYSRQSVHELLKRVGQMLPPKVRMEIIDCFRDNSGTSFAA